MNQNIHIRKEQKVDIPAVFDLNCAAFEQEEEANLVDALRKNEQVFIPELSIVATLGDQIVGHILFSKIKIIDAEQKKHESLALAPMAVVPTFQNKGIGGQLVRYGLQRAKELGYNSVIVLGHEHYYPRFGFVSAEKWGIKAPYEVPTSFFMGIELQEGALETVSGVVEYPAEFEGI